MTKKAANLLDSARKKHDGTDRIDALQSAVQQQEQVVAAMRQALLYMKKSSSYQEAVTLIYQVLSLQGKVNRETIRVHQRRIQSVFGDDNKKDDKKDSKKDDGKKDDKSSGRNN